MGEAEVRCVQKLTLEAEIARDAVLGVSRDGQVDRGQMHADLVRPSRLETDVEERMLPHPLAQLEAGDCLPRLVRVERASRRIAPIASDGSIDPSRARPRSASD